MQADSFLTRVKSGGGYQSKGEASRAAHAVFGTIKTWFPPDTAEELGRCLSGDASQLWRYSPVAALSGPPRFREGAEDAGGWRYFVLRVQQLGHYRSPGEARRAASSVLEALAQVLPGEQLPLPRVTFPGTDGLSGDTTWAA